MCHHEFHNVQEGRLTTSYIKFKLWDCMYVRSLIAREQINRFAPNLACIFLETRQRIQKGRNSENTVISSSPGEVASCSSETTQHEEQGRDKRRLFRRKDYKKKGHNLEKVSWVLASVKVFLTQQLSFKEDKKIYLSKTSLTQFKLIKSKRITK
jgi:hypothetical protein